MDIENTRSPYSLPMSPMMRPKCCEESAGFPPDHLEPSMRDESAGARVTRIADATAKQLSREDLLNGIVAQLMTRLGLTCIVLPSFDVECGPRVTVTPERVLPHTKDKHYFVQTKPGKAGS
jgi:hypothetical protein